jgi:5-methylcytosine-specific restriction endonuclease McrA
VIILLGYALVSRWASRWENRCPEPTCRRSLRHAKVHVDHITPLARGGSGDRRNIQLLCAACNLAKAARDPLEHAKSLGRLI